MASLKRWLDRRRNPWKAVFYDAFNRWRKENGEQKLRSYETLPKSAVVFDMGGFQGTWAEAVLAAQPGAQVHVFEPHPGFAEQLDARFSDDPEVTVYPYALGKESGTLNLSDAGDSSSAVASHDKSVEAKVVAVKSFFDEFETPEIDLMKVNIEGGEYDLLPALIDAGVISKIKRLQIQFHLFEPEMRNLRDQVRQQLEKTHRCVWEYPFVWEEWHAR